MFRLVRAAVVPNRGTLVRKYPLLARNTFSTTTTSPNTATESNKNRTTAKDKAFLRLFQVI